MFSPDPATVRRTTLSNIEQSLRRLIANEPASVLIHSSDQRRTKVHSSRLLSRLEHHLFTLREPPSECWQA